jgi:hypothetical protein
MKKYHLNSIVLLCSLIYFIPLNAQDGVKCIVWPDTTKPNGLLIQRYKPNIDAGSDFQYLDLDQDGDPDILRGVTADGYPFQWIDDDDDMKGTDILGDTDSDCFMLDKNKDGHYGGEYDFIVDWNDEDQDNRADMQVIVDNASREDEVWDEGHFMITIDSDNDGIFNFIDWNTYSLQAWEHQGCCDFFQDYSGNSLFMKIHTSTFNMEDLRYNWENPFLFYDKDDDGLTEMAIRFVDAPEIDEDRKPYPLSLTGRVGDVRITYDLDNDNGDGNEFDFDMSLLYRGNGFDYSNQVHRFENISGLEGTDTFFIDSRFREMKELIYVGHDAAYGKVYNEGDWSTCYFVFDEDDDCHRWERVEFYDPLDPFKIGAWNKGLDSNPQADASGDRGEWDMDFSGEGKLYIGKFDGKIHLYGAEKGAWRIDQHAKFYQGWQGWRTGEDTIPHDHFVYEPAIFPTLLYTDTDNNGFFDKLEYDFDGDGIFEEVVDLDELNVADTSQLFEPAVMDYEDYMNLFKQVAENTWKTAEAAIKLAEKEGIDTGWYAFYKNPSSLQEKYHQGFWLNYYIYKDLLSKMHRAGNHDKYDLIKKAYYSNDWSMVE